MPENATAKLVIVVVTPLQPPLLALSVPPQFLQQKQQPLPQVQQAQLLLQQPLEVLQILLMLPLLQQQHQPHLPVE